jgi:hypothetical protein
LSTVSVISISITTALAATPPSSKVMINNQELRVQGHILKINEVTKGTERIVTVTERGETFVAVYNSSTNLLTIKHPDGDASTFNIKKGDVKSPLTHDSPQLLSESVDAQWWGDYCQDNILSSGQYWLAEINNDSASWTGKESSGNSSQLLSFWNAVTATHNAIDTFYVEAGSSVSAGIVAVITSATAVAPIVAACVALGLGVAAGYSAAQAWTDHRTDVVDYYQIPGA